MLNRLRSHISGNAIAYVALFIALGGTSYGLASGSVDSREIRNNTIRTGDLRNNEVRSRDIRNRTIVARDLLSNTLGGNQIDEGELGEVPLATRSESADNALALGGIAAANFAAAPVKATVNFSDEGSGTVLTVPNFGRLYVDNDPADECDPDPGNERVVLRWQNTTSAEQNLFGFTATDGGAVTTPEAAEVPAGGNEPFESIASTAGYVDALIRPTNSTTAQVRLTAFVGINGDFDDICRIAAQASASG